MRSVENAYCINHKLDIKLFKLFEPDILIRDNMKRKKLLDFGYF